MTRKSSKYLIVLCLIINASAYSQILNQSFVNHNINKIGLTPQLKNTNLLNGKTILLLTPSFPVSFSRIEQDSLMNWRIGSQANIGGAYYFLVGTGYGNTNGTVEVEPIFVFGASINGGISQNLQSPGVVGNLNVGGVIGFYKYLNFLFTYDLLAKKWVYGVGARVDLFAITQGAGTIILNRNKFFK